MVLQRPRTIIIMAVNSAKNAVKDSSSNWKEVIDFDFLKGKVGNDGFSSSPSSSSSSFSASKAASS